MKIWPFGGNVEREEPSEVVATIRRLMTSMRSEAGGLVELTKPVTIVEDEGTTVLEVTEREMRVIRSCVDRCRNM